MNKKKNDEVDDFEKLQKLGFEFDNPQDEFSYQPDSGGVASGLIGKQEYGIDSDLDAAGSSKILDENILDDPSIEVPGESEWSQSNRILDENLAVDINNESDDNLFFMIYEQIDQHPDLSGLDLTVEVTDGQVVLTGEVNSEDIKSLVTEVIAEIPGITDLTNNLIIS